MEETMSERLKQIIAYKTGGHKTEFCALLGWKPPYLAKLLRGSDFGITPLRTILAAFPEVDARWFLFGTGQMLGEERMSAVRREMLEAVFAVLDLERFMPVMSPEELHKYEAHITAGTRPDFSPDTVAAWEERLAHRDAERAARFAALNSPKTGTGKERG